MMKRMTCLGLFPLMLIPYIELLSHFKLLNLIAFAMYLAYAVVCFLGKEDKLRDYMIIPAVLWTIEAVILGSPDLFIPIAIYPIVLWQDCAENKQTSIRSLYIVSFGCLVALLTGDSGTAAGLVGKMHYYAPLLTAFITPILVAPSAPPPQLNIESKNIRRIKELEASIDKIKEEKKSSGLTKNGLLGAVLGLSYEGFDYDAAVKATIETLHQSAEASFVAYYHLDKAAKTYVLDTSIGHAPFKLQDEIPVGIGTIGQVGLTRQYIYVNQLHDKEKDDAKRNLLGRTDGLLSLPVNVKEEARNVIYIGLPKMEADCEQDTLNLCLIAADKLAKEIEKMAVHAQVEKKGMTDKLTGLYNRQFFDETFDSLFQEAASQGTPLAYALLDLDFFKQMNDTHGHDFGDKVLVEAARTFKRNVRPTDYVCRTGGDEFSLILPGADKKAAFAILRRIKEDYARVVEEQHLYAEKDGVPVKSSLSMGAAVFPSQRASTSQDLMKLADKAVYHVKEHGKNNFAIAK